jgi:UDP-GlcNAc:undecaprenyl-phosphate/decaprenyl-phosphate GlcNAc-1-phosphate transferase
MSFVPFIFCIVLGFLCCWGLIPLIRKLALSRAETNRAADFHHSHGTPVPRLGGIALAASFVCLASALIFFAPVTTTPIPLRIVIVLGCLGMFGVGLWDDFRPLGAKIKLVAQIAIATAVYFGGIQIEVFKNPFTNAQYALGVLGFAATVLWLVTLTNLVNLIDGLDGLAGGIAFMLMCLLANVGMGVHSTFTTLLSAGMAGALLGFLYYNFPPAKIYLGDGGAYFLGFLIGILSIQNSHKGSVAAALIAPLFALALPIVDVSLAILRRGLKGLPLFRPDRKHIHHRLVEFGLSRQRTVLVLYSISCLCLFLAFAAFWLQGQMKLPLLLGTLFLILIIAGRSLGFIKNWFGLLSRLLRSLELRQETRYALTLSKWLEMEAERRDSVYELWQDYQFVVKKLGFSEVKVTLPDGSNTWRTSATHTRVHELQRARHETPGGAVIEFAAEVAVMPEKLFELLAELAAETWHKSALTWQRKNKAPLQFVSVASPDTSYFKRKLNRLYAPGEVRWWEQERLVASGSG